ncbi:MAG: argininosuccinate lyase [Candidatus Helarchaeota archaeon]
MSYKPWGGRFSKGPDKLLEEYTAAEDIELDKKLIIYDILGTEAHDIMLNKIGALKYEALKKILTELDNLKSLWEKGEFQLKIEQEDVHMNVEKFVSDKAGEDIGGMMHLARSRNDQILVDLRLYIRDEICEIIDDLLNVIGVFMDKAKITSKIVMPAYTHFQPAQPITFGFWCMAHADAFIRDLSRLEQVYQRINTNPLGTGAIAGVSWPIDRKLTTELLGFDSIQENALDVISSRGEFIAEVIAISSIIMTHLNKICTDLILWSSKEFDMIELDDAFTTGSSIMPQKKNADAAELVRAKNGKVNGYLMQVLGILHGLPSGYNRDFQETKGPIIYAIDTVKASIKIVAEMVKTLKINEERMQILAKSNFITATELIDLFMKKGDISFRTAHRVVGKLINKLISEGIDYKSIEATKVNEILKDILNKNLNLTNEEIQDAIDPWKTVQKRKHIGGPAEEEVLRMLEDRKNIIENFSKKNLEKKEKIKNSYNELQKKVQMIIANNLKYK